MKIDFHILDETSNLKSLHYACELIEQAHQTGEPVYIHTNSQDDAERLDALLWTFREDSFIPHAIYSADEACPPPVQIGYDKAPDHPTGTLINLSKEAPSSSPQFNHIIEIVFPDPIVQQLARERFKQYRDQGHEIQTHKTK